MIGIIASLTIFVLYVVIVVPGLAALAWARAVAPAMLFYAVLFLALGAYHVSFPKAAHPDLLRPVPTLISPEGHATELCGQVLTQARQGGIIIDRPNDRQVRVNRDYWSQMPEAVKEAIGSCLRAPSRPGAPQMDVEIVEVAG